MTEELTKSEFEKKGISPVYILNSNKNETNDSEGKFQDFIEIILPCLITINASASASYTGNTVNSGIRLRILLDKKLVASDMSFEGESSKITFYSSASYTVYLEPGKYNLEVYRDDIRTNSGFRLNVDYFGIYARKIKLIP